MTATRFLIAGAFAVLALGGAWSTARSAPQANQTPAASSTRPRLIVIFVIDQFRGDYINTYGHQWTAGLRRLVDRSAIFPLSAYTYATTKTCPGHATIATGTLPSTHGMIDNQWYDRDERRTVVCTEDASVTPVSFGGIEGREHHSLKRLMTATFADELRTQLPTMPRVVALSLKPRSAILLAGRGAPGTIAVWAEPNGAFTTSTMYTATAWPEVDEFVRARPIASAHGHEWTRRLDPAAYLFDDAGLGEPAANVFPHVIAGRTGQPDTSFATAWQRSPLSDAYLGEMAANLVDRLKLGQTQGTDLLAVSFSALDLVGHQYGPRSHEVQDVLANLDQTIGRLLAALDKSVGRNRYVIGLTSDHGVPDVPEQAAARSMPAGRLSMTTLRRGLEDAMVAALGPGPHVAALTSPYVYFTPESLGRLKTNEQARQAATKLLAGTAGVRRVVWADELRTPSPEDSTLGAVYRSYVPARSGDIMLVFEPYWVPQSTGTTHGTPWDHDQRVPLLFHGAGIAPGRYLTPAGPVDLAPTLAHIAGITLARTDGRVLTEALAR